MKVDISDINNIDQLLDFNIKFAENFIKMTRKFTPQIVIRQNDNIIPIAIAGDRSTMKNAISLIEKNKENIDWIVMMHEAYMEAKVVKNMDEIEKYKPGNFEERYLAGDKNIKWVFTIQAYWKDKKGAEKKWIKKMQVYEIKAVTLDFALHSETNDFVGLLAIDLDDQNVEIGEKKLREFAKLFAKEGMLQKKFAKNIISEKELLSEVRKLGLKIPEDDEQKYITYIIEKESKGGETEEEFKKRALIRLKDFVLNS